MCQFGDMDSQDELFAQVKEKALRLLSIREHARKELEWKLSKKKYPRDLIQKALGELEEEAALSNERFAKEKARSLILQDYGPRYILQTLRQLDVEFSSDELNEVYAALEIKPHSQIQRLMAKKIRSSLEGNTEEKDFQKIESKVASTLYRRGFDVAPVMLECKKMIQNFQA